MGGIAEEPAPHARGLFVTATDTGVGKTVLSAALLASMRAAGERVRAHKPVVTGLDSPAGTREGPAETSAMRPDGPVPCLAPEHWPADHELLALAAGMEAHEVAPLRFGPAVSPRLAAALAGVDLDADALVSSARRAHEPGTIAIVEGVGGLLVPFTERFDVRDLAVALGLPTLIAARPGLGTISHTLLTLEAARAVGIDVRAVVLTPWPRAPEELERSNREEIARRGEVEVVVLRHVRGPELSELERAGRWLPWRRWLQRTAGAPAGDLEAPAPRMRAGAAITAGAREIARP